ncbi:response regulator [Flavobacterium tegetincola]|uniref:response regulator n=1 Tax=Flavobacterium tegetincola TaxID=150172 RepID=UPI00047DE441|nr:response regulator [Flavobacterium tegetincola]
MMHDLLLADDDCDDCLFFQEALDELPMDCILTTVNDGVALMAYLTQSTSRLPKALFLDLNMPLKSGFECLSEIRSIEHLKQLPVIIFSTSFDTEVIHSLYANGASYYIRKPGEFDSLKYVIEEAIRRVDVSNFTQPARNHFIIQP